MVWISEPEPLQHPEIGRLARRVVDAGRHVFIQTNGADLRRRIHEFRPVSRLFLTVQLDGLEEKHNRRAGREGAFRDALDGIRTAKLSGFLVCAQLVVDAETEKSELLKLRELLEFRDVDGIIVSPQREGARNEVLAMQRRLKEARAQVASRRWRWFSRLLDDSLDAVPATQPSLQGEAGDAGADACEEGVSAS